MNLLWVHPALRDQVGEVADEKCIAYHDYPYDQYFIRALNSCSYWGHVLYCAL